MKRDDTETLALAEAIEAYECLWGSVAALAAGAGQGPAGAAADMRDALERERTHDLGGLERSLLARVAASCGNRVLAREALELRAVVDRELEDGAPLRSRDLGVAIHARLISAIETSDAGRARDAIRRHSRLLRHELGLLRG